MADRAEKLRQIALRNAQALASNKTPSMPPPPPPPPQEEKAPLVFTPKFTTTKVNRSASVDEEDDGRKVWFAQVLELPVTNYDDETFEGLDLSLPLVSILKKKSTRACTKSSTTSSRVYKTERRKSSQKFIEAPIRRKNLPMNPLFSLAENEEEEEEIRVQTESNVKVETTGRLSDLQKVANRIRGESQFLQESDYVKYVKQQFGHPRIEGHFTEADRQKVILENALQGRVKQYASKFDVSNAALSNVVLKKNLQTISAFVDDPEVILWVEMEDEIEEIYWVDIDTGNFTWHRPVQGYFTTPEMAAAARKILPPRKLLPLD